MFCVLLKRFIVLLKKTTFSQNKIRHTDGLAGQGCLGRRGGTNGSIGGPRQGQVGWDGQALVTVETRFIQGRADYMPHEDILRIEGRTAEAAMEEDRVETCGVAFSAFAVHPSSAPNRTAKRQRTESDKKRVMYRSKSKRNLVELDNALKGADGSGPGLARFQCPVDWPSDP